MHITIIKIVEALLERIEQRIAERQKRKNERRHPITRPATKTVQIGEEKMNLKEFSDALDATTDEVRVHAALLKELVAAAPEEVRKRTVRSWMIDRLPLRGLCWSEEEFTALAQYHLEKLGRKSEAPWLARAAAERAINILEQDVEQAEQIAEYVDRIVERAVKSLIEEVKEKPWRVEP